LKLAGITFVVRVEDLPKKTRRLVREQVENGKYHTDISFNRKKKYEAVVRAWDC
jgi:hypothetical protein